MILYERLQAYLNQDDDDCTTLRRRSIKKAREALNVIDDAYTRFADEEIAISYNGGKDCLVLLALLVAFLQNRSDLYATGKRRIKSVYVSIKDPFLEVDHFVASSAEEYGLDVVKIQKPMKEAFGEYLVEHPTVRAILVGTRRNDPHGSELSYFDVTDQGWPKFMRIHPIINWEYAEVWDFLRGLEIPYCVLYDRGYTSLGGRGDTLPNPSLRVVEDAGSETKWLADNYRPAWQLDDGTEERRGRDQARNKGPEAASTINARNSVDVDQKR